jgi:hypothetical protein
MNNHISYILIKNEDEYLDFVNIAFYEYKWNHGDKLTGYNPYIYVEKTQPIILIEVSDNKTDNDSKLIIWRPLKTVQTEYEILKSKDSYKSLIPVDKN